MTTKTESPTPQAAAVAPVVIDWREVARAALGSAFVAVLVGGALHVLANMIAAEAERTRESSPPHADSEEAAHPDHSNDTGDDDSDNDDESEAKEAAALLGVGLDASEAEVRAALRARLTESRAHPDHGGDGDEAARLIAARDLLVEHARAAAQP